MDLIQNKYRSCQWLNHHLDGVRLYFEGVEQVAEKSQLILQQTLTDKDYVNLVAARAGDVVIVSPHSKDAPSGSTTPILLIQDRRAIRANGREELVVVKHRSLPKLKRGYTFLLPKFPYSWLRPGKGLGTLMLAEQIEAARTFGFEKIFDYADKKEGRNGYYRWPRLGFDKELTKEDASCLPDRFKHFRRLSDLMEDQQAREWWREYGFVIGADF